MSGLGEEKKIQPLPKIGLKSAVLEITRKIKGLPFWNVYPIFFVVRALYY